MTKKNFDRRQAYLRALGHLTEYAKDKPRWTQELIPAMKAKGMRTPDLHDPKGMAVERVLKRAWRRVPYWKAQGHDEDSAWGFAIDESAQFWLEDLAICGYREAAA